MYQTKTEPVHIRWLTRRDVEEVLQIERAAFGDDAWTEEEFLSCLRSRHCIGMVAERRCQVVGYVLYELHADRLHLMNFVVDPAHQRQGIGRALWHKIVSKLSSERRRLVTLTVRQDNFDAQKFFQRMWFVCTRTTDAEDVWGIKGYEGYWMEYDLDPLDSEAARAACIPNKVTGGV